MLNRLCVEVCLQLMTRQMSDVIPTKSVFWKELPKKGGSVSSWDASTAAVIGHRFYFLPSRAKPDQLYTLDLNLNRWSEARITGDVPRVVGDAALVAVDDKFIFVETRTKDLWTAKRVLVLDLVTHEWSQIDLRGESLYAYGYCLANYWEARGNILFLGRRKLRENLFFINLVKVESMEAIGLRVASELKVDITATGIYRCFSSLFVSTRDRWVVCCGDLRSCLYTIDLGRGLPRWNRVSTHAVSGGFDTCSPFLSGSRLLYIGGRAGYGDSIKVFDYNLETDEVSDSLTSYGQMPKGYQTFSPTVAPRSADEFVYITQRTGDSSKTRTFLGRLIPTFRSNSDD